MPRGANYKRKQCIQLRPLDNKLHDLTRLLNCLFIELHALDHLPLATSMK